ncbi:unnamed protein product [Rotaria sp. Silwood1]|nr:unnamed protein product [Rotaria sp. Silwood1]CAF1683992.1 unnamed protein product [Rotaria sp. Silwood1]
MTDQIVRQTTPLTTSVNKSEQQSKLHNEQSTGTPIPCHESHHEHHRVFAPLNTPMYRRRQTLTIFVGFIVPWFCLYISLQCLRSDNPYIFYCFLVYLSWMVLFRKHPRQGGLKQQWLRRLVWWKWFAGE